MVSVRMGGKEVLKKEMKLETREREGYDVGGSYLSSLPNVILFLILSPSLIQASSSSSRAGPSSRRCVVYVGVRHKNYYYLPFLPRSQL